MFTVTASDRSNSSSASSAHTATPPPPLMALPPSVTSLEVIDPCNRTGKIRVPMTHVAETAGIVDFHLAPERRQGKELSLCLLFQKGRCNAGARCHQVHAAPEYVALLREQAASTRNCCADHGDMHSSGSFAAFIAETVAVVDASTGSVGRFAIGAFARTACLDAVLRGARRGVEPRVPAAKVCRLHAQGRCKFGKDCRNIHLCPAAVPLAGSTSGAAAVAAAAPSAAFFLPTPPAALLPTGGPKPFPAPIGALSVSSSEHGGSSSCGGSTPSDTPRMQPAARRFGAPIIAPPTPVTIHVAPPAPIGSAADSTTAAASLPLLPPPTTAKPLSLWSCEGFGLLAAGSDAHNSGFFGSERSSTAAADAAAAALRRKQEDEEIAGLDMSAFEATLKSLCDDLARADFSPAAAQRSNPLFAA